LFSYSPAVDVEAGVAREVRSPDGKIGITIHTDAPPGLQHHGGWQGGIGAFPAGAGTC
jgi:hypothetical protein